MNFTLILIFCIDLLNVTILSKFYPYDSLKVNSIKRVPKMFVEHDRITIIAK